jgi:hypothetical protein
MDEEGVMVADRLERWALALIAVLMLPVALQAAFFPETWFEEFPFGRGWIAAEGGTYDEHLVRDVGVLFLSLIVVTAWAAWRGRATQPVAVAWLLQGVLHFSYHVGHLDGLDGVDQVGLVGSLVAVPALAVISLVAGSRVRAADAAS